MPPVRPDPVPVPVGAVTSAPSSGAAATWAARTGGRRTSANSGAGLRQLTRRNPAQHPRQAAGGWRTGGDRRNAYLHTFRYADGDAAFGWSGRWANETKPRCVTAALLLGLAGPRWEREAEGREGKQKQNRSRPHPHACALERGSIEALRSIPLSSFPSPATGCLSASHPVGSIHHRPSCARLKRAWPVVLHPTRNPTEMRASAFSIPFSRPVHVSFRSWSCVLARRAG